MKKQPRGIRNNNPGNIRIANNNWMGKVPVSENTDGEFEQFTEMKYGVRAMTILFKNYLLRNPAHTLRSMIAMYAPASENNTDAYVNAVSKAIGVPTDQPANDWFWQKDMLTDFINAVIKHENGMSIADYDVERGINLSGVLG